MHIDDFDYYLPESLIASAPLKHRIDSRMLTVNRRAGSISDSIFAKLPEFLKSGDVLAVNNTKVFPARLIGETESGAKIEVFLIEEIEPLVWKILAKPGKKLKWGKRVCFDESLSATAIDKSNGGFVTIRFDSDDDLSDLIDRIGLTPLPHYIKRDAGEDPGDRERYQTVYARSRGAIAAPTAGLHFTHEMLACIRDLGVAVVEITLHVGYGTFEPVRVDDVSKHRVLSERYEVSEDVADVLNKAREDKQRIIAVGTTTTRALESTLSEESIFSAGSGRTALTVTPGYKFKAVDAMLTNFHLPKSSLLILVSTFGGHELIMNAYSHAVASNYRFYSYGDCMLIT